MKLTKEAIQKIFDEKPDECDLATWMSSAISSSEIIAEQVNRRYKIINEANAKYQETMKKMELEITELQKQCKHWLTNYHPDPSGNSDSYYSCDICDKILT